MRVMSIFAKFRRLPTHWKVLLGGQAIITCGIVAQRLAYITAKDRQQEKKRVLVADKTTK